MKPSTSPRLTRPPVWTRVADDNGGGHSHTNFELLYFEGDQDEATRATLGAFGVAPEDGSEEYGPTLSFRTGSSFAELSWHERGCDWDPAAQKPIERHCGDSWLGRGPKLHTSEQWAARCESDIASAIAHSRDWRTPRHEKMACFDRMSTLAMATRSTVNGLVHKSRGASALELFEIYFSGSGADRAQGPHGAYVAGTMLECMAIAAHCALERLGGNNESPEAWRALADRLEGSDYEAIRVQIEGFFEVRALDDAMTMLMACPPPNVPWRADELAAGIGAASGASLMARFEQDPSFLRGASDLRPVVRAALERRLLDLQAEPGASHSAPGLRL